MDLSNRLSISYYKTIATLNESHKIYLVQHQSTNKIYVKKVLDVYNKNVFETLRNNHIPGTPQIIDIYEENNQLTVIEDYISGRSLEEIMKTTSLNISSVYKYTLQLCGILEKLHSLKPSIIHRDIKPSNIIVTECDNIILLDFNAAKYHNDACESDTILLGTQGYAAPEQYGFGSSSPKTDIYALGIVLKELTKNITSVPSELSALINKCIQMNPDDRFANVTELKNTLLHIINPQSKTNASPKRKLSLAPPGFRTLTPWKMIFSFFTYLFLIYLSFTMEVENVFGMQLWIERIFCFIMYMLIILICNNYLNVQSYFPLCCHQNKFIKILGVAILVIAAIFIDLTIMSIIIITFF